MDWAEDNYIRLVPSLFMIADNVLIVLLPGEFAARAAFLDSTNSLCSLDYGEVALNF